MADILTNCNLRRVPRSARMLLRVAAILLVGAHCCCVSAHQDQQSASSPSSLNATASGADLASSLAPASPAAPTTELPAPSSSTAPLGREAGKRRRQQQAGAETMAAAATGESASFAGPAPRDEQQPRAAANRWTHFGARLRPLAHEQHVAAANSKSQAVSSAPNPERRPAQAANSNSLEAADEQDDEDEDADSEALLYKMMQQQTFLLSPSWQQQQAAAERRPAPQQVAADIGSSKRVIKLLKSYSHIHQVDDSDDQIRGTRTRVHALRRQQPQVTRPRSPPGQQRPLVLVSAQPMSQAHSAPNGRHAQPPPERDARGGAGAEVSPEPGAEDDAPAAGAQPEEEEFECPNNGIFADVSSGCQAYHVCQSGAQVQQKFQCPLGTLFNDIILTCDFAHNVQCKSREPPADVPQFPPAPPPPQSRPAPQASQPRAPQQTHWSPAAPEQSGPRALQIGRSQYSRHQPALGSSLARAVSAYPSNERRASSSTTESSREDADDEQSAPLVPATLPPRVHQPQVHLQSQPVLPYSAPPPPQQQQQQRAEPRHPQPPQPTGQEFGHSVGNWDGASASVPVFASRDETQAPGGQQAAEEHKSAAREPQEEVLNLVINHVAAPTRHQPAQRLQVDQQLSGAELERRAKPTRVQPAPDRSVVLTRDSHAQGQPESANPRFTSATRNPHRQQVQLQRIPHQQRLGNQRQASTPKSVFVSGGQERALGRNTAVYVAKQQVAGAHSARPPLVDLTSDGRRAQSVSSEAMNDGLLLIVRHSAGASPIQLSSSDSPAASGGQAYALDPQAVRPNSVDDARLFPNVQQLLQAQQSRPSVSHQAPASASSAPRPQSSELQSVASSQSVAASPTANVTSTSAPSVAKSSKKSQLAKRPASKVAGAQSESKNRKEQSSPSPVTKRTLVRKLKAAAQPPTQRRTTSTTSTSTTPTTSTSSTTAASPTS